MKEYNVYVKTIKTDESGNKSSLKQTMFYIRLTIK